MRHFEYFLNIVHCLQWASAALCTAADCNGIDYDTESDKSAPTMPVKTRLAA